MVTEKSVGNGMSAVRLWVHEATRVFHDRLISAEDREWYYGECAGLVFKHFRLGGKGWTKDDLFSHESDKDEDFGKITTVPSEEEEGGGNIIRGRINMWLDIGHPGVSPSERVYCESKNPKSIINVLNDYQAEYNVTEAAQLNLVFFNDAVRHIVRICR